MVSIKKKKKDTEEVKWLTPLGAVAESEFIQDPG